MINFRCDCGQTLFFENTGCMQCGSRVGFDPVQRRMRTLMTESNKVLFSASGRMCKNGVDHNVCNWIVHEPDQDYCISCRLNQTIPNLLEYDRVRWWKSLEHAKRRLIYSLLALGLPLAGKRESEDGLAFRFIEDQRTNPNVYEEHVFTGHSNGVITINVAEADDVSREIARQYSGELYRTLLGHFRHESGHYYFHLLVNDEQRLIRFRSTFGDERQDYQTALRRHYENTPDRDLDYISAYAQSHPLEDWAEVWAHYLHMTDTLETAGYYGLPQGSDRFDKLEDLLLKWSELTLLLNSLNRSMGMEDAYPFVFSGATLRKLHFVHDLIYPS